MSKIQSRLNSLQPFVVGVRLQNGMSIVDAVFKDGWAVPKSEIIESRAGEGDGSDEINYHMFFTQKDNLGLDEILDYIEKVIGLNVEREKKHALLKVKAKELTELFKKNPLSKLQDMKFVLSGEKLIEDMQPDTADVVDFDIDIPLTPEPKPQVVAKPQPNPQPNPQPQVVVNPQPEVVAEPVIDTSNLRRAPNGEIIPPLSKEDTGEIDEDFQKIDITPAEEPVITKKVKGQNIDLPSKKKKKNIQLDEINEPQNIVCKCEGDDVCPACIDEKIGTY